MGTEKRERQKANRALKQQEEEQAQARRKTLRYALIAVGAIAALVLFVWIASTIVTDDDEPTPTVPAATVPADSEPATEPGDTEPAETEPADTEPADTGATTTG